MGRPIGSLNRQKPFADALRMEIWAGNDPRHLRAIARKLFEKALDGDLQAIREIADKREARAGNRARRRSGGNAVRPRTVRDHSGWIAAPVAPLAPTMAGSSTSIRLAVSSISDRAPLACSWLWARAHR
jgi:hypothetical protein